VAAAAGAIWFLGGARNPYFTAIGVICIFVGGFPIFHEAWENIVQRCMTMELSMTIATVAALAIRELFTALVITLFVLVAEILEGLTVGRGRKAIQRLIDLLPGTATVRREGDWKDVEVQQVSVGEEVLVRPGSRIPVDGAVVGGHSFVDQAPITGESMPVEKVAGLWYLPGQSTSRGPSKFASNVWAGIRLSAKSLRPSNERKNPVPPFRESRTSWRATSPISLLPQRR
jgi:cation transport ATPase